MIEAVIRYFIERKARKKKKQYDRGYDYAAGRLLSGSMSPMDLDAEHDFMFPGGELLLF